jgi:hypothetical protein
LALEGQAFSRVSVFVDACRQNLEVTGGSTPTPNDNPWWIYNSDMPSNMDNMADEQCINTEQDARGQF